MISIIIPTYNRESTIKRSIDSILRQTYQDFEIIVVDDNSTDNTKKVVLDIKDKRVKYIKHEYNLGANAARNTGVENARGDIVAFQDSDDEWAENKLEKQLYYMELKDADIVSCCISKFEGKNRGKVIPGRKIDSKNIKTELLYGNFISGQTILGKKECFVEEKFDDTLPRLQEWELMIRLSQKYNIYFINEPLVNVYVQNDSISNQPKKAILALELIIEKHHDLIFSDNMAVATIYNMLGKYNMEINSYNENYYFKAIKYNKKDIKLYIKTLLYVIKKYLR